MSMCAQEAVACLCEEEEGHEGEHICPCGGTWTGTYPDDWTPRQLPGSKMDSPMLRFIFDTFGLTEEFAAKTVDQELT